MATAAARLLSILKTQVIRDALVEVCCPQSGCKNRDPKRWVVEDRPIKTAFDFGCAPMVCDVCGQQCVYHQTPPTLVDLRKIEELVTFYLAGWNCTKRVADSAYKAAAMEDVDARLRRLRDENLRRAFVGG